MMKIQTGAPHFKSLMKQCRNANYTFSKSFNEFVDNAIKRATQMQLCTQVDDNQRLQELRVSDNIESGFDNMDQQGNKNPFNMGHIKDAHDDDSETSEFGIGMKAGAISAANQLNVYTRITGSDGVVKYVEVICDFIRMADTEDVNESYNPFVREISREEYQMNHPYEQGSTIKLSKIRDTIYPRTTQQDITNHICSELSATYTRFVANGSVITVNGKQVEPVYDFFEDEKCKPFNVTKEMFIFENGLNNKYIIRRKTIHCVSWQEYHRSDGLWKKLEGDGIKYIADLQSNGYKSLYKPFNEDGVCLQLKTTFVFYSDMFHRSDGKSLPMTDDALLIYKDDRNYSKQSIFVHRNGSHNYTLHEMDFVSKRLGKDIGITFNKEILMNGSNELIIAIKTALADSKDDFSADTSCKKNDKLCKKAIDLGLIDPSTCSKKKLYHPKKTDSSSNSETGSDTETVASSRNKPAKKSKPVAKKTTSPVAADPPFVSPPAATVVQSAITTLNAWFPEEPVATEEPAAIDEEPVAIEDPQPENPPKIEEVAVEDKMEEHHVSEIRRRRTIDVIVRLQKMIADELELSEEALSAIESAIA